jgi:hypothetical protein
MKSWPIRPTTAAGTDVEREHPGALFAPQSIDEQFAEFFHIDGDDGKDGPELDHHDEGFRLVQTEKML